jgi:hypothetical protein
MGALSNQLKAAIVSKQEDLKKKAKGYFAKRTPEQVEADRIAEQKKIDAERLRKQGEEELKYQESLKKQPSKFEEDVSKVGKSVVKGGKTVIKTVVPAMKKVLPTVKKSLPVIKKAARETGDTVIEVAQAVTKPLEAAKINEEKFVKSRSSKSHLRSPPVKRYGKVSIQTPSPKPSRVDSFDDFGMGGRSTRKSSPSRGDREFSVSGRSKPMPEVGDDDDYFVSTRRLKGKGKKPKEENSGFGLGF